MKSFVSAPFAAKRDILRKYISYLLYKSFEFPVDILMTDTSLRWH